MNKRILSILRLSKIIIPVLRGEANQEEEILFKKWLDGSERRKQFISKLEDDQFISTQYRAYESIDVEKNIIRCREKLLERRRRKLFIYSCASIFLGVLLIGGGRIFLNKLQPDPALQITMIRDNPVLILPDGSQVVIDRDKYGSQIATQSNIDVLREEARLIQKSKSDTVFLPEDAILNNTLIVPKGMTFDMILYDGTHVWLNADSRLEYPPVFAGPERRVYLEGEAFFEVTHNVDKPFIVETRSQITKVLGTGFNISAYPDDPYLRTVLVTGKVSIGTIGGRDDVILSPGQQATVFSGSHDVTITDVDTSELTAWRNGLFVFDGLTLEKVFMKLSRWYDLEYEFKDVETSGLVLRGSIPIYDEIDKVINLIEVLGTASVEIKGKKLMIGTKE